MIDNKKNFKAFTLAEVFVAMLVMTTLVAVCMSFFVSRRDYRREYMFYTAYRNILNVVDTALMRELYLQNPNSKRVQETTCGLSDNPKKCRAFVDLSEESNVDTVAELGLCSIFVDYFNTSTVPNCKVALSNASISTRITENTKMAFKITNGMEFYFENIKPYLITKLNHEDLLSVSKKAYKFWVDIDGVGNGEDRYYYDQFAFYVTLEGKVIPNYGAVEGLRGYEYVTDATCGSSGASGLKCDGGGNKGLIAFDVLRTDTTGTTESEKQLLNYYKIPSGLHAVSFPHAACASGYVYDGTAYCKDYKINGVGVTLNDVCDVTIEGNEGSDCKIRLMQKLKRVK